MAIGSHKGCRGRSEYKPELRIGFGGVKGTGPDRLLVLQNVLGHADEWMEIPRSLPQIFLFNHGRRVYFKSGAWGLTGGLLSCLVWY